MKCEAGVRFQVFDRVFVRLKSGIRTPGFILSASPKTYVVTIPDCYWKKGYPSQNKRFPIDAVSPRYTPSEEFHEIPRLNLGPFTITTRQTGSYYSTVWEWDTLGGKCCIDPFGSTHQNRYRALEYAYEMWNSKKIYTTLLQIHQRHPKLLSFADYNSLYSSLEFL